VNKYLIALMMITVLYACDKIKDELEETLDGEATMLKEVDLPNCSKVITCCDALEARGIAEEVVAACKGQFKPAANLVIDNYRTAQQSITDMLEDTAEALDDLKDTTQGSFEPGCRCFLEESVGQVNTGSIDLLPVDCEINTSTGELSGGLMCSDATDSLLNAAMNSDN